jgi:hypothetical protein
VKEDIKIFLGTCDLDDLLEIRSNISELDREDEAEMIRILKEWKNIQAISNLLMYPNLIPKSERIGYVLKALQENNYKYLVLSSVVGINELDIESLSPILSKEIINQIIVIAKTEMGIIAERASIFLASRLWHFGDSYKSQIVQLLDHSSDVVKHNILVALIPLVGLKNIRHFLKRSVHHGLLTEAGQLFTEQKISKISGFSKDNIVDMEQLNLGILSIPLLSYIPNLDDF